MRETPAARESPSELVGYLLRSENRVAVLAALASGSATRPGLRAETGIDRATLDRLLGELCRRQLVTRTGRRYEVTPFGASLARRLRSVFDSVDVVQRLQLLLGQLPTADPDTGPPGGTTGEILAPTSPDPDAPTRRFVDILRTASDVRLLAPAIDPVSVDGALVVGAAGRTFELVIPRAALEEVTEPPTSAPWLRDVVVSGNPRLFVSDGDVPYLVGTLDDVAVVGLTDERVVRGYVETTDEAVRSLAGATVEAYRRGSRRIDIGDLTD